MAPVLIESGATRLAVAVVTEALELRRAVQKAPIMILGYTPVSYVEEIVENDIEVTAYNYEYVRQLSERLIDIIKSKNTYSCGYWYGTYRFFTYRK